MKAENQTHLPLRRDTQAEAWRTIQKDLPEIQATILLEIRVAGGRGITCQEVELKLRMTHQTASAAINKLARKGWACDTSIRRINASGARAIAWTLGDGTPPARRKTTGERLGEALALVQDLAIAYSSTMLPIGQEGVVAKSTRSDLLYAADRMLLQEQAALSCHNAKNR